MPKKIWLIILLVFIGLAGWTGCVKAGFGISPPYVKSDKITPGSHYEQRITLLRSSAEEDLQAEITVNAPEIDSWLKIDKGTVFDLPKGELQVPMVVIVEVPKDTEVGNYTGYINIRIAPKTGGGGGVAIALGARIDIDLNVTNESFPDFMIRAVAMPDIEVLKKPWSWRIFSYFFYRLRVIMTIENTGNIDIAPSKVSLDVYDLNEKDHLESLDDKSIEKIKPYQTKEVLAAFPTRLKAGQYWGKIKIYKDEEVVRSDKISFTIAEPGQLGGKAPKLGIWPYLEMAGIILFLLLILFALFKLKSWKYLIFILMIILWPFKIAGKRILIIFNNIKIAFWRWMHKKSSKYQNYDERRNNKK